MSFRSAVSLVLLSWLGLAWAQNNWDHRYYQQYNNCPPGFRLIHGRCERYTQPSYPYPPPQPYPPHPTRRPSYEPQNLIQPVTCPEGFKSARGVCSKMTEREIELDRLPKDPCPPGQRRSRLVCRPYTYV